MPAASGLFTSTDPESRRVKPESVNGRVVVKVVYVVLEAQYQSAISTAVKSINAKNPKVGSRASAADSRSARVSLQRTRQAKRRGQRSECGADLGWRHGSLCVQQVCFEVVGYLLEELRDAKNFELFQKDVDEANIFIGSLIFIEELAEKVRPRARHISAHSASACPPAYIRSAALVQPVASIRLPDNTIRPVLEQLC